MASLRVRIFRSDRSCLLLIVPLTLVLVSVDLGGRDLWAPDEPRTGEVVREILLTGSWAVLHDNGRAYLEKPPLYFWLAALTSRAAGHVSEMTVRLPSSLSALLCVVAVFYLGRGLFGRRTGALASVVLVTTQKFFMEARWAHPDMLWTLFLTFSCLAFHQAQRPGGDRRWLAGFYPALGLAMLTKGPLGLLLPLAAASLFLVTSGEHSLLRRSGVSWGLPLALAPTALWLAAYHAVSRAPFPAGEAVARMLERFTRGIHHPRPFTHLLTSLLLDTLPWLVVLPAALAHTFPERRGRADRDVAYLYSWIAVLVAVFAVSAEKRGVYLLPLLPLLALLVGRLWDTALLGWEPSPVDGPIAWSLGAGLVLSAGAAAFFLPRIGRELPGLLRPAALLAALALLTAVAALVVLRRRGGGTALGVLSAGLTVCYMVIVLSVLPALDASKSARPFCARVAAAVGAAPLAMYLDYHAAYVFYTRRFIEVLPDREALAAFLRSGRPAYCLIEEDRYEVERRRLGLATHVVDRERIGHRGMLLVSAGPSPAEAGEGGGGGTP